MSGVVVVDVVVAVAAFVVAAAVVWCFFVVVAVVVGVVVVSRLVRVLDMSLATVEGVPKVLTLALRPIQVIKAPQLDGFESTGGPLAEPLRLLLLVVVVVVVAAVLLMLAVVPLTFVVSGI